MSYTTLSEEQSSAKINADIAAEVAKELENTGDLDQAVKLVASARKIGVDIVSSNYRDCIGDAGAISNKRKPDSFHINGWVQDVMKLMDADPDLLLHDACQQVSTQAEKDGISLYVESPQRMSNIFSTYVGRGVIKYNIFSRVKNKISDPKPPSSIRSADSKKMVREYLRLNHLGVRNKEELVNKVVRCFKHKYTPAVVEEFLSKQEKWDRIVG